MTLFELLSILCPFVGLCWGIKAGWQHGVLGVIFCGLGGAVAGLVFYVLLMGILGLFLWLHIKWYGEDFSDEGNPSHTE